MKTKTKNWIKPGALCNCNGEGGDTLIIRTVDKEKERASVCVLKEGMNLDLKQAQALWQYGFYCWKSFDKLHQELLSIPAAEFNLVKKFGLKKLNAIVRTSSKLIKVPCPDNAEKMLLKHFDITEEQYFDAGAGVYMAAYLSEKMLKLNNRNLDLAVGRIVGYLTILNMNMCLSGVKFEYDKQVALLIESLCVEAKEVDNFVKTMNEWWDAMYRQSAQSFA